MSNLDQLTSGQIVNGVAAPYQFTIAEILQRAWSKISGFKATFWGASLIYLGILTGVSMVISLGYIILVKMVGEGVFITVYKPIAQFIVNMAMLPTLIGLYLMSVKRMADQPVKATMILNYFYRFFPIIGVYLLSTLITCVLGGIGIFSFILAANSVSYFVMRFAFLLSGLLFSVAALYLIVGYAFAPFLTAEKKLGVMASLKISRKAVGQHWFKIFSLIIITVLMMLGSMVLLLVPFVWTLPWIYCAWGELYRIMFGLGGGQ